MSRSVSYGGYPVMHVKYQVRFVDKTSQNSQNPIYEVEYGARSVIVARIQCPFGDAQALFRDHALLPDGGVCHVSPWGYDPIILITEHVS